MAKIVGVHGINHEYLGSHIIHSQWFPAIQDGLANVDFILDSAEILRCAFYGNVFRKTSTKSRGSIPRYRAQDVTEFEQEILLLWAQEAQQLESDNDTKGIAANTVQAALRCLSRSDTFSGLAENMIIFLVKQVGAYLQKPMIREEIMKRVAACIEPDTRILIGHSLGSVVCYESLAAHPEWPITHFISIGSPLGIQQLIFDKLQPPPVNGQGQWPGSIQQWVNISDPNDIVALEKELDPLFSGNLDDREVFNGLKFHNATHYLASAAFGDALKQGLLAS